MRCCCMRCCCMSLNEERIDRFTDITKKLKIIYMTINKISFNLFILLN